MNKEVIIVLLSVIAAVFALTIFMINAPGRYTFHTEGKAAFIMDTQTGDLKSLPTADNPMQIIFHWDGSISKLESDESGNRLQQVE